jgi:hypothetical protein
VGFSFNPVKGLTRALGIPDKARLTYHAVGKSLTEGLISSGLRTVTGAVAKKPTPPPSAPYTNAYGPSPAYNVSYQAPSYQAPYYGGGGGGGYDAYTLQPQQPYGVPSWAYSTGSPIYSTPQYPAYSAPTQGRSWEDLTSLAGAVLPFFL